MTKKEKLLETIYVDPITASEGGYDAGTAKVLLAGSCVEEMEAGEYKLVRRVLLKESVDVTVTPIPKPKPKPKKKLMKKPAKKAAKKKGK